MEVIDKGAVISVFPSIQCRVEKNGTSAEILEGTSSQGPTRVVNIPVIMRSDNWGSRPGDSVSSHWPIYEPLYRH